MVAMAVMSFTIVVTLGFIFLSRQKAVLSADRDQLAGALEYTRQQSIAAYRGYQYGINFDSVTGEYTITPENTKKSLRKGVRFNSLSANQITFAKLTGRPDQPFELTLTSGGFNTTITIDAQGTLSKSPVGR